MSTDNPIESFTGPFRFLSNFFPCDIDFSGYTYPTLEHAFQAAKTNDLSARKVILQAISPGKAKYAGRRVLLRSDWEEVKQDIMLSLLRKKFSDDGLKGMLLDTGNRKLIEGNNWGDTYWGVYNGTGDNFLGKLLMQVREEARSGKL